VNAALAAQPLSFEANVGQTDSRVNFLVREPGSTVFLTPTEAVQSGQANGSPIALGMEFVGAQANAQPVGVNELPGRINYILGNDPSKWHTEVPHYAGVEYQNVYPGVNLDYHGTSSGQLEYDFVVAAGANPGVIRLQFPAATSLDLNSQGDLIVHTAAGIEVQQAPVLYQQDGAGRQSVAGRFVIEGNQVGFAVGSHDAGKPLVIDPVIVYTPMNTPTLDSRFVYYAQVGGEYDEMGLADAVDSQGNTYVTGFTTSDDFPVTNGTQLNQDIINQPVDLVPNLGPFYPPNNGHLGGYGSPFLPNPNGAYQDIFVSKLDPSGNLVFSTYLGGSGTDVGRGIAIDPLNQVYLTGGTNSVDFPIQRDPQGNVLQAVLATPTFSNAFLTKLSADGSTVLYSTYFGQSWSGHWMGYLGGYPNPYAYTYYEQWQIGNGVAVDPYGTAYFTGGTGGIENIATPLFQPTPPPDQFHVWDAFVAKLEINDPNLPPRPPYGPSFIDIYGGTGVFNDPNYMAGHDMGYAIALDSNYNFYVTGQTASEDYPVTLGAFQPVLGGNYDAFVTKFGWDPVYGYVMYYSTFYGGSDNDDGYGIAVDPAGNAFITGDTISTDFPVTAGAFQTQDHLDGFGNPTWDAFVAKLNPAGSAPVYSTYLGGANEDHGYAIALNPLTDEAYVTGSTVYQGMWYPQFPQQSPLVNPGPPPTMPYENMTRAFLTHVNNTGTNLVFSSIVGLEEASGQGIALDTTPGDPTAGDPHMTGWLGGQQTPDDVLVAIAAV
jgi:hypothetical protein